MFPCAGYWEPRLARLDQSGMINAWMGKNSKSWLQVRNITFISFMLNLECVFLMFLKQVMACDIIALLVALV